MTKTIEKALLGVLAVLILGIGSALVAANFVMQDDETEEDEGAEVPITGSALEKASAAALAYMGEGTVTDTEAGDEEGFYEVEVTLNDGREADVHLDENFNVLTVEIDDGEDDEEE